MTYRLATIHSLQRDIRTDGDDDRRQPLNRTMSSIVT